MREASVAIAALLAMSSYGAWMLRRHPWDLWRLRRSERLRRGLMLVCWRIDLVATELQVVHAQVQNMCGNGSDLVDEVVVPSRRVYLQPVWVLRRNRSQHVSTWERL